MSKLPHHTDCQSPIFRESSWCSLCKPSRVLSRVVVQARFAAYKSSHEISGRVEPALPSERKNGLQTTSHIVPKEDHQTPIGVEQTLHGPQTSKDKSTGCPMVQYDCCETVFFVRSDVII